MGSLDLPLSDAGHRQVSAAVEKISELAVSAVYAAPCQAALQTAEALGARLGIKVKTIDALRNLDHGLWHGKRIEEVRQTQPRVFRQWQENPQTVCPPEGEMVGDAQARVRSALAKLLKKHKQGVVALIAPEPLASLIGAELDRRAVGDLWKAGCRCGDYDVVELGEAGPKTPPAETHSPAPVDAPAPQTAPRIAGGTA